LITVGAGVAVLLVIGLVAGFLWLKGDDDAGQQGGPADATAARDVAKSYLEALARGDAEAALALSDNQPATTDLLTDEVLEKQIKRAPITDIQVGDVTERSDDGTRVKVRVSARIGNQRQESDLPMVYRDGQWKLKNAFVRSQASFRGNDDMYAESLLTFFGTRVPKSGTIYVFPGPLEAGTTSKFIEVVPLRQIVLDDLDGGATLDPTFSVNDAGRKAAEEALRAFLTKCLQPGSRPERCNGIISVPGGDLESKKVALAGPIDLSRVTFDYDGRSRRMIAIGDIPDIPVIMNDLDGVPGPDTVHAIVRENIDLGVDPPVVVE
jgi:hypothetical protein